MRKIWLKMYLPNYGLTFETWQNNDGKEGYIYAMAKNVAFDFIKHKRLENDYRRNK